MNISYKKKLKKKKKFIFPYFKVLHDSSHESWSLPQDLSSFPVGLYNWSSKSIQVVRDKVFTFSFVLNKKPIGMTWKLTSSFFVTRLYMNQQGPPHDSYMLSLR